MVSIASAFPSSVAIRILGFVHLWPSSRALVAVLVSVFFAATLPNAAATGQIPPTPPPPNAAADYQLGESYLPPAGVTVVARDWRQQAATGKYGICYVNGFQTQPEQRKFWRTQHPQLLLRDARGNLVEDRNWPGEYLLDISTTAKREAIADIATGWLNLCVKHGFSAVEPDNLDSWTRSGGLLKKRHAIAMAKQFVQIGHSLGLAVAQKNAGEVLPHAADIGFDFAVVEECERYRECDQFTAQFGAHVIEIEYRKRAFVRACSRRGVLISVVRRDLLLRSPNHGGYRYQTC